MAKYVKTEEGYKLKSELQSVTSVNGQTGDVTVFNGSWNELSDRPFYEEESRTLVSPQTVTGYGYFYGEQIEIGKTYKVIVDGIEFVLVCDEVFYEPGFWPEAFEGHFVDSNGFDSFGFFYHNGAYQVNYCESKITRHTIAIYTVGEVVQLDEKFIPESIARIEDIQVTSVNGQTGDVTVFNGSWNELSDRPFYEKKKLLVYSGNLKNNEEIDDFPIYVGKEYTLVVNGVAKICIATQGYAYGEANGAVLDDDTGFGFMSTYDSEREYVYFSSGKRPPDTNTYTVSLYEGTDEIVIVQLDEKFIPDTIARVSDIPEIPDAVITPTTAQVGQTIGVKSVDENGKPTEWEAVDPFVLTDESSGVKYKLSVVSGKLTMTEVTA